MSYDDGDTNPKSYGFHKTEIFNKDGYEFSTFVMSLKTLENIFTEDFGGDFSPITGYENITLTYDSIISIKEPKASTPNATMNSNRVISNGEYYRTADGNINFNESIYLKSSKIPSWKTSYDESKKGIIGARDWIEETKNDFPYKFNQSVFIPAEQKPKIDKPVKVIYKDTSGNILYEDIVKTYTVNDQGEVHTETAPNIAGYEFKTSDVDYGYGYNSPDSNNVRSFTVKASNPKHDICFIYEKKTYNDESPGDGIIEFTPHTSNWLNSPYLIKVNVKGNTTIKKYGYENRSYSYTTSSGSTVTKTISFPFCETWSIGKINVTGSGVDLKSTVSYNFDTTLDDGASFSLNTNAQNIKFNGRLVGWVSNGKSFISGDPPKGSWITNNISNFTTMPTETYESNSKIYKMDQIAPIITPSIYNSIWKNSDMTITLDANDNLSGINSVYYSFNIIDASHYSRNSISSLNYIGISNNKHLYNKDILLNKDGIYTISGNITDEAQNSTSFSYGSYHIDKTQPYDATFSDDKREYIDDKLTVTVTTRDNLSGVSKIEYAVTNNAKYNNEKKTTLTQSTPENSPNSTTSFNVDIEKNGTWYIHTWVYDRAGNVKYNTSKGYKYFKIDPNTDITISPSENNNNALRGTRFDVITSIDAFTTLDASCSSLIYTMPNWVNDNTNKKVNGTYSITPGHGTKKIAKVYQNARNSKIDLWHGFVPPYGTPLTKDKNGNIIGNEYTVTIQLEYDDSNFGLKKTKPITRSFAVIPEQIVKPQITSNEK